MAATFWCKKMQVTLSPLGGSGNQFFDNSGNPLSGGKIYTYIAGTTTPQMTYTSVSGLTAHSNPIVLNSAGRVSTGEIWLTDTLVYKFVVKDANDVLIATYDDITGINANYVNFTNLQEIQTASAGQTVFTLTTMQYSMGTNSLSVFVDGVNQYGPSAQYAYTETSPNVVTFNSGVSAGAKVKFTTAQLNTGAGPNSSQISYLAPFTSSVARSVQTKFSDVISVKDFGATGDGATDDTTAIVNADAAAQAAGKCLYFPSGVYIAASTITMTAPAWRGDAAETSILKLKLGATTTNLVQIGPATGTTSKVSCSVENMWFNGNSGCSDSVVKLRNVQQSRFAFLIVSNGAKDGFSTNTSTASINTQILRNDYTNLISRNNAGVGFLFVGEKDTRFDNLFAHNNGSHGFKFQAFKDDGNNLAETTQCVITSLLSRDNGNNGFVFDMVEKYVAGSLESTINGGAGFQFESTLLGATSYGSNSLLCGTMISRNDAQGAFRMTNTAYVYGLKIGSFSAYGFGSTINYPGVIIYGGSSISFGSALIQGFKGTGVYLQSGNPFGGVGFETNNVYFGLLKLTGNGDATANNNSGLVILNNSFDITIDNFISSNLQTNSTTSEYELSVASTAGPVHIGFARLTAAQAGYELNIGSSETYIETYKKRYEKGVLTLMDNGSNPTTNISNHAQIYVDSSDGDLKVRFSNGTIQTIATN